MKLPEQEKAAHRAAFRKMSGREKLDHIFTYYKWPILLGLAALIVLVPALVTALVARYACKMSFLQICGLLTGATTNAPVLEFVKENYGSDRATVSYATVYPFALFLQVMVAQILIILSFVL